MATPLKMTLIIEFSCRRDRLIVPARPPIFEIKLYGDRVAGHFPSYQRFLLEARASDTISFVYPLAIEREHVCNFFIARIGATFIEDS